MWKFPDLLKKVEQSGESNQNVPIITEPDDENNRKILPAATSIPGIKTLIEGTGFIGSILSNTGVGTFTPYYEPLPFYDYSLFRDEYG